MAGVNKSTVVKGLKKKGFEKEVDGDHLRFNHKYNGEYSGVHTYVSHGSTKYNSLGNDLQEKMKNQLKLPTLKNFRDLVNCPMKEQDYIKILKKLDILK